MACQALDEQTVVDYLENCPAKEGISDKDTSLAAAEVGDGNLNQVFVITTRDTDSPQDRATFLLGDHQLTMSLDLIYDYLVIMPKSRGRMIDLWFETWAVPTGLPSTAPL